MFIYILSTKAVLCTIKQVALNLCFVVSFAIVLNTNNMLKYVKENYLPRLKTISPLYHFPTFWLYPVFLCLAPIE